MGEETSKLRQRFEERLLRDRELWMQREQELQKKLDALDQEWRRRWLARTGSAAPDAPPDPSAGPPAPEPPPPPAG
jgi:hypothetical protein